MKYISTGHPLPKMHYSPLRNLLFIALLMTSLASCGWQEEVIPIEEDFSNTNLTLGNPTDALPTYLDSDNFLIDLPQYTVSYSNSRGIPNWVSWHLDLSWMGDAERSSYFSRNKELPTEWAPVTTNNYKNTGFDRGHNCPSADRTSSEDDNRSTFLMTNIVPQAPRHNQRVWKKLEAYSRDLVEEGNELYIIMGNYGEGGIGRNGYAETISEGRVTVPKYIWKTIVVLPEGDDDISRIQADTRIITVLIENVNDDLLDWGEYRVSIDEIEDAIGFDLLSRLPLSLQDAVEGIVDEGPTK